MTKVYSIEGWQPGTPLTSSPQHQEPSKHRPTDEKVISDGQARGDGYVALYSQTKYPEWKLEFERWLYTPTQ